MNARFERVIWIVLDSVGVGAMPDAADYGDDSGCNTVGNIARQRPLKLTNLRALGLANIKSFENLAAVDQPTAAFGECSLLSPGKDSTTGHWEMAGVILEKPFPIYPEGFPPDVISEFERRIGRRTLGNKPASGTEIIRELGPEHIRTGFPIVYTSADSVFQVAAHEDVIPVSELHQICASARELLHGPHEVGRVIARPFVGEPGRFTRTANRKDFAVPPPKGMLLDRLAERSIPVRAIGKIYDIFLGRGITRKVKTKDNAEGMAQTNAAMATQDGGLIFTNLVDFDQNYGHRNDVEGYARALEEFDSWLPSLELRKSDLLIVTADHGCDPTTPSTDHTREFVPVLVCGDSVKAVPLGTRRSLADIGQTVAENFGVAIPAGASFLASI